MENFSNEKENNFSDIFSVSSNNDSDNNISDNDMFDKTK